MVRNIKLFNCDVQTTMLGTIVAEECIVENLKTHDLFFIYGAVFKHVVLRGRFGSLMFTEFIPEEDEETKGQKALFRNGSVLDIGNSFLFRLSPKIQQMIDMVPHRLESVICSRR